MGLNSACAYVAITFLCLGLPWISCKNKPPEPVAKVNSGYPAAIEAILVTRCATSGCHNLASYQNAGGLLLDTWEHLFRGSNNGSVVIPYSPKNSTLLFFLNTDISEGPTALPTMPLNATQLTKEEYSLIREWILAGAPNESSTIAFASNMGARQKIYITQQGCDQVAVVDAATGVVMRSIPIGMENSIEVPHYLRFSSDGRYAYVSFTAGRYIQKIDAVRDSVVASVDIGDGSWNAFGISLDGKKLVVSDWQGSGGIVIINTESMTVDAKFLRIFRNPHGIAINQTADTFFITSQYGNVVYRFTPNAPQIQEISIDGNLPNFLSQTRDPHEIHMAPDYSKYFLTCQASNEIRVMDAHADTLIKAIPVGVYPQEMAISLKQPYLFVSCTEDASSFPGYKGSLYVINYNTLEVVKRIDGKFSQPHGMAVDDQKGLLYISNRNADPNGPAPHHSSACSGRNGYYNIYDIATLEPAPVNKRYEILVDPYSADARFK